jgi:DNA polymerase-3 subunit gamma/tau
VSKALYRKYRSKSLAEIVGQSHVTDVLKRSLDQGRIAHAYLLTGPRGVGKTSIARILAHEINKLPYSEDSSYLDIIEIDAASNNGVEDVRDLREKVQIAPVSAAKKIYIIDEVHMLSKAAFNALLKTLEEPPEHAVFILATTDADKLPQTIISRTQRFSFRAITAKDAVAHLRYIADEEKIAIDDDALALIATRGDGSFRDSISLLDQLASLAGGKEAIATSDVERALGLAPSEHVKKLLTAYENHNLEDIVKLIDESEQAGTQAGVLASQLIQTVRNFIAEKPDLLPLLDQLLEVAKSTQPDIKLLTVLALPSQPQKPKTVALSAPAATISAPIKELEQQATKQKPSLPEIPRGQKRAPKTQSAPVKIIERDPDSIDFDWDKLIQYTRENYVAIYSVLSKCTPELEGATLRLYTGNAFYKKKLDDSKHHINLSKSLVETGIGELNIETIGTPPPPKDSTAAAVAAIMGGGEEVSVGE